MGEKSSYNTYKSTNKPTLEELEQNIDHAEYKIGGRRVKHLVRRSGYRKSLQSHNRNFLGVMGIEKGGMGKGFGKNNLGKKYKSFGNFGTFLDTSPNNGRGLKLSR